MQEPNFELGPEKNDGRADIAGDELPISTEDAQEIIAQNKEALKHPIGQRIHDPSLPKRPPLSDLLKSERKLGEENQDESGEAR